ncbi:MAG: hypothetical protein EBY22_16585 [Gammaproteobacteria bacterium]|nr:hypothetical protein [Gammaproteobacteria bacterium]
MSDAKEREFKLTGGAARSINPSAYRRCRTRKQYGGDISGPLLQLAGQSAAAGYVAPDTQNLASQYASATAAAMSQFGPGKQQGGNTGATVNLSSTRSTPLAPGAPAPEPIVSGIAVSQPAPFQGGSRLVLTAPKRKSRIALRAKKLKGGSDASLALIPSVGGAKGIKGITKKSRKIHLRVKGVTARLNKAKKAKKTADATPLSTLKLRLEKAGIIKKGSKAPEPMLRTMYTDLLITKKGL